MIAWQITTPNEISKTNVTENLEHIDDVKVKVTKCFITRQDITTFIDGSKDSTPIIPGQVAVGQITETLQDSNYFKKATKVYISPEKRCNNCVNCLAANDDVCLNIQFAGRDYNGYLKEFAVIPKESAHILPPTVTEHDALFIHDISIALSVIDNLKIEKGEHVAIIGGTVFANILAQIIAYYQAVPIIIDSSEANLDLAAKCGIYYTLNADKNIEREIITITGGRKCRKVVYVTESKINFDIVGKLAAPNAIVGVSGSTGSKAKLNIDIGLTNQLDVKFITCGLGNCSAGINLLAQKSIKLSEFNIPEYKFDYVNKQFEKYSKLSENEPNEFIVNFI